MIEIVYRQEHDRWIKGDRYIRPGIRRLIRGRKTQFSGMERVVLNFLKGLQQKGTAYSFNKPTFFLKKSQPIISFGLGRSGVAGIPKEAPLIAAIGFPYPAEFPDLCEKYNVKKFLVHSEWALNFVKSAQLYPDHIFDLWPAGIDTYEWSPEPILHKLTDLLIYNKIMWDREKMNNALRMPIISLIKEFGLTYEEITYGNYSSEEYKKALNRCRAMIFLCEHESQGLAYQECLSCNVPVFAWDQGFWLDPIRFKYNQPIVPATSVPYFDKRCGMIFKNMDEFEKLFPSFWDAVLHNQFSPSEYILENLALEKSAKKMLNIVDAL